MQTKLVEERLVQFILSGELPAGARVKEEALAKQLGVSRTPLRQALISLAGQGFLNSRPNAGYTIKPLSEEEASELYPIVWTLEELALHDAFDKARTNLADLRSLNEKFLKAAASPERARDLDVQFHAHLLRSCGNKTLHELLAPLKLRLLRYENRYMEEAALVKTSYLQHKAIISALEDGSRKKAVDALRENWQFGMNALIARISEAQIS